MTISVIIPVYKVEKYVRRCIESVIAQECDKFNVECIIVDDCTPDGSMAIVQDVIDNYQGTSVSFNVLHHEVNKGLSNARNSGIKVATGDFLFFIDSDDFIMENTFKSFVSCFVGRPNVDVIVGNSLWVENNYLTNTPINNNDSAPMYIDDKRKIIELVLRRRIDRNVWNKLIRRSLVIDNEIFFVSGMLYEDVIWTYKMYSCASSVLIAPGLTYMYENNPSSIIHTPQERSNQMVWSFANIVEYLLENPPVIDGKKSFFAAHHLFAHYWTQKAIYLYDKFGADTETTNKLKSIKRTLLKDAFLHVRPFMVLYFLVMFAPFNVLMKSELFRRNLDRINRVVYMLS